MQHSGAWMRERGAPLWRFPTLTRDVSRETSAPPTGSSPEIQGLYGRQITGHPPSITRVSTAVLEDDPQPGSACQRTLNALKYKWLSYSCLKDTRRAPGERRK